MVGFTAHNILLDNGRWTKPENNSPTEDYVFVSLCAAGAEPGFPRR
jgi:hypothetical protein